MSELIAYWKDKNIKFNNDYRNSNIMDLATLKVKDRVINQDISSPIYFDNSNVSLSIINHSCAHLMAQAIRELYSDALFFVGPAVEEGFYYDFYTEHKVSFEDLEKIEKKMHEISKRNLSINRVDLTKDEAKESFKADFLKQRILEKITDEEVSYYEQGEFKDLCRGPHVPNTSLLQHFKLTKLSGAYLFNDENEMMLKRIYGVAFATKDALKEHLELLEEAKKRDHRKIGKELGYFTFDEEVGAGLTIWLPRGGRLKRNLEDLITGFLISQDYEPAKGPEILKSQAWIRSGHYHHYRENMYFTSIDGVEYGLKPMNCIGHIKVYESSLRSYKELPLRFYEYGIVHRHEKSGVLHGLLRVREFTQDDAHIFCTKEQIQGEVAQILDFVKNIMEIFNFEYEVELSTRPDNYIGDIGVWEEATQSLVKALEIKNIPYNVDEGGGAFYGPKIDIKITDALKRKWQCGTVQIDMNLPERFLLTYTDEDNTPKQPIMIHRAILGSFERFIAILIEHFNGELPFFIAPTNVGIIPIKKDHLTYALTLKESLKNIKVFAKIFDKEESLGKRIRNAELEKIPLLVILGQKEVDNKIISVRDRMNRKEYSIKEEDFLMQVKEMKNSKYKIKG